jgi:hypothetical protein
MPSCRYGLQRRSVAKMSRETAIGRAVMRQWQDNAMEAMVMALSQQKTRETRDVGRPFDPTDPKEPAGADDQAGKAS